MAATSCLPAIRATSAARACGGRLIQLRSRYGRSPAEVAVAWVLGHHAVTAAIVGARRPGQMPGVIGAADFRLELADHAEIDRVSLLRDAA